MTSACAPGDEDLSGSRLDFVSDGDDLFVLEKLLRSDVIVSKRAVSGDVNSLLSMVFYQLGLD